MLLPTTSLACTSSAIVSSDKQICTSMAGGRMKCEISPTILATLDRPGTENCVTILDKNTKTVIGTIKIKYNYVQKVIPLRVLYYTSNYVKSEMTLNECDCSQEFCDNFGTWDQDLNNAEAQKSFWDTQSTHFPGGSKCVRYDFSGDCTAMKCKFSQCVAKMCSFIRYSILPREVFGLVSELQNPTYRAGITISQIDSNPNVSPGKEGSEIILYSGYWDGKSMTPSDSVLGIVPVGKLDGGGVGNQFPISPANKLLIEASYSSTDGPPSYGRIIYGPMNDKGDFTPYGTKDEINRSGIGDIQASSLLDLFYANSPLSFNIDPSSVHCTIGSCFSPWPGMADITSRYQDPSFNFTEVPGAMNSSFYTIEGDSNGQPTAVLTDVREKSPVTFTLAPLKPLVLIRSVDEVCPRARFLDGSGTPGFFTVRIAAHSLCKSGTVTFQVDNPNVIITTGSVLLPVAIDLKKPDEISSDPLYVFIINGRSDSAGNLNFNLNLVSGKNNYAVVVTMVLQLNPDGYTDDSKTTVKLSTGETGETTDPVSSVSDVVGGDLTSVLGIVIGAVAAAFLILWLLKRYGPSLVKKAKEFITKCKLRRAKSESSKKK